MTITNVRSFSAISASTGTAVSVTIGVSPAAGNLLVCAVGSDSTGSATTPAGWTLIKNLRGSGLVYLFAKVAAGTETSVATTLSVTGNWNIHYVEYNSTLGTWATNGPGANQTVTATNLSTTALTTGTTAAVTVNSFVSVAAITYAGANQAPTWSPAAYTTIANTTSSTVALSMMTANNINFGTGTKSVTGTVTTATSGLGALAVFEEPGQRPNPKVKSVAQSINRMRW